MPTPIDLNTPATPPAVNPTVEQAATMRSMLRASPSALAGTTVPDGNTPGIELHRDYAQSDGSEVVAVWRCISLAPPVWAKLWSVESDDAVLFRPQSLDPEQQTTARDNIGAMPVLTGVADPNTLSLEYQQGTTYFQFGENGDFVAQWVCNSGVAWERSSQTLSGTSDPNTLSMGLEYPKGTIYHQFDENGVFVRQWVCDEAGTWEPAATGAVLYDAVQTLTAPQQAQARANIEAGHALSGVADPNGVAGLLIAGVNGLTFLPEQPGPPSEKFYGPEGFVIDDEDDARPVCYNNDGLWYLMPGGNVGGLALEYYSSSTIENDEWAQSVLTGVPVTSLSLGNALSADAGTVYNQLDESDELVAVWVSNGDGSWSAQVSPANVLTALHAMDGTQEAGARTAIKAVGYEAQTLTPAEKALAQANTGTLPADQRLAAVNLPIGKFGMPHAGGMVSFIFDDGQSAYIYNQAVDTMDGYLALFSAPRTNTPEGMPGCAAINATLRRNFATIEAFRDYWLEVEANGWEIANHGAAHLALSSVTTDAARDAEVNGALETLRGWGMDVTTYVYPFGSNDAPGRAKVAEKHSNAHAVAAASVNLTPIYSYSLGRVGFGTDTIGTSNPHNLHTLAHYQAFATEAKNCNGWAVFMLHSHMYTPGVAWATGTAYNTTNNRIVTHGGVRYAAKSAHTSSAGNEPGTGGGNAVWWVAADDLAVLSALLDWLDAEQIPVLRPRDALARIGNTVEIGDHNYSLLPNGTAFPTPATVIGPTGKVYEPRLARAVVGLGRKSYERERDGQRYGVPVPVVAGQIYTADCIIGRTMISRDNNQDNLNTVVWNPEAAGGNGWRAGMQRLRLVSCNNAAQRIRVEGPRFYLSGYTPWITGFAYTTSQDGGVIHNGQRYTVKSNHTAGSTTEPGVGANWETTWNLGGYLECNHWARFVLVGGLGVLHTANLRLMLGIGAVGAHTNLTGANLAGLLIDMSHPTVPNNMMVMSRGLNSVTVDANTDTITCATQEFQTGTQLYVAGTAVPGGLAANTIYYAIRTSATTFQVAASAADAAAGTAINITDNGNTVTVRGSEIVDTGIAVSEVNLCGSATNNVWTVDLSTEIGLRVWRNTSLLATIPITNHIAKNAMMSWFLHMTGPSNGVTATNGSLFLQEVEWGFNCDPWE